MEFNNYSICTQFDTLPVSSKIIENSFYVKLNENYSLIVSRNHHLFLKLVFWRQFYKRNFVLKKTKLVLNTMMVRQLNHDQTTVLLCSKLSYRTIKQYKIKISFLRKKLFHRIVFCAQIKKTAVPRIPKELFKIVFWQVNA